MSEPIPSLAAMLRQLIASASVSCTEPEIDMSNLGVIELLAEWLDSLGFRTEIVPLAGRPDKANLIATLGSGSGGLVLSGHTDTVPFAEHRWSVDPLTLTEKDNRWYGLGATDMKGFFPVAIAAARAFVEQPLREPLIILATADEESSMDGARELAAAGRPRGRTAIIGEPTDLKPIRMHKGILMDAINVTGRAGHSSNPALGNNALEAMHVVMTALLTLRAEWQARYKNPAFAVPTPTLNLGCIHGGDNPNRICGECELHFDLRPLPGMDLEALRPRIEQRLQPIAEQLGVNISLRPLVPGVPAFEQAADSELVKLAESMTGADARAVNFCTEGPFLQQLGMDTIVLGPGSIDQAHQADEYIAMEQLQPGIDLYTRFIRHYCL